MKLTGRSALGLVLWAVVVLLGAFALLRAFHYEDSSARFFGLVAVTWLLLLPAYVVFVVALAVRARLLAALALVLVLAHAGWSAPELRWWATSDPESNFATDAPAQIHVAAANVRFDNTRVEDAAAALRRLDADVLVVEELTPAMADALRSGGGYGNVAEDPREGAFGSGIYSRYPVHDVERYELGGLPALRAGVATPQGDITVVAVHTLQPLRGLSTLRRQLRELDGWVTQALRADRNVVLAGDFNATRQHRAYRRLLDDGLRDAHGEQGRSFSHTWPADRWYPPLVQLDHVLVSARVNVHDAGTAAIPGSDHRAVTTVLDLGRRVEQ